MLEGEEVLESAQETKDILLPILIAAGITMLAALCIFICIRRQHKKTKGAPPLALASTRALAPAPAPAEHHPISNPNQARSTR